VRRNISDEQLGERILCTYNVYTGTYIHTHTYTIAVITDRSPQLQSQLQAQPRDEIIPLFYIVPF